jgi:hypothetical protein
MDQNQLATLEREADALLSRDPAYQSMYKKIYGEAYVPLGGGKENLVKSAEQRLKERKFD